MLTGKNSNRNTHFCNDKITSIRDTRIFKIIYSFKSKREYEKSQENRKSQH